jgi:hypothetical protein
MLHLTHEQAADFCKRTEQAAKALKRAGGQKC